MPTRSKQFFEATSFGREWEPFWRELWGQVEGVLATSEELVMIGYSMPEADGAARALGSFGKKGSDKSMVRAKQ